MSLKRVITFLPRKVHGGFKCIKEHGLRYTFDRMLVKLHLKQKKNYEYYCKLSPKKYPQELKSWYKEKTGETLHLNNPKTFNEKIQWLKLYDSTPLKTRLADKYLVRDWVKEKVGEDHLVPLLGVWDKFDDIDFDKLPDKFVLKANHGSGWNIIVTDKSSLDKVKAKEDMDKWLNKNYAFQPGLELHYMNIPPKVIAEQYIENADGLIDYRFYCFNGKPEQVWVDIFSGTPNHLRNIFDMDWNLLDVRCKWPQAGKKLEKKPHCFDEMKDIAIKLSKDFAFVRVDFFEIDNHVYVGEMTFTPMKGIELFYPKQWNLILGEKIILPEKSPMPKRERAQTN